MADQMDVRTSLALAHEALVGTDVGELVSDAGVRIDLGHGDQHAIVVAPVLTCSHASYRATDANPRVQSDYNASEHLDTLADLKLRTEAPLPSDAATTPLPLSPTSGTFSLYYGQVIALGGDLFANFDQLAGSQDQVKAILNVVNEKELAPISRAVGQGDQPSGVYQQNENQSVWNSVEIYGVPVPVPMSPLDAALNNASGKNYVALAASNFDHFGVDAVTAYTAGHLTAQQKACAAAGIPDPLARRRALLNAYAVNAFADHFLTDLFAAGHIRTPRRQIQQSATIDLTRMVAGLCAKRMHDEDNKFGLWVTNRVGDSWVAYGDDRYRDTWNAAGRVVLKAALQQSIDDIWDSFSSTVVADGDAQKVLAYVPTLVWDSTSPEARDDPSNWAPLFWCEAGTRAVSRRADPTDPSDRSTFLAEGSLLWPVPFTHTWTPVETWLAVWKAPLHMPNDAYPGGAPPDDTGPTGQYGWPPKPPGTIWGPKGASGPTLRSHPFTWSIDRTQGPTQPPPA